MKKLLSSIVSVVLLNFEANAWNGLTIEILSFEFDNYDPVALFYLGWAPGDYFTVEVLGMKYENA